MAHGGRSGGTRYMGAAPNRTAHKPRDSRAQIDLDPPVSRPIGSAGHQASVALHNEQPAH